MRYVSFTHHYNWLTKTTWHIGQKTVEVMGQVCQWQGMRLIIASQTSVIYGECFGEAANVRPDDQEVILEAIEKLPR